MALFSSAGTFSPPSRATSFRAGCGIIMVPAEQARRILSKVYSPKCVEGAFSKVALLLVLSHTTLHCTSVGEGHCGEESNDNQAVLDCAHAVADGHACDGGRTGNAWSLRCSRQRTGGGREIGPVPSHRERGESLLGCRGGWFRHTWCPHWAWGLHPRSSLGV